MSKLIEAAYKAAASGRCPKRFYKDASYIGVSTKRKDSFGDWTTQLSADVFKGRPYSIHDYDAIFEIVHFDGGHYRMFMDAIFEEARANNRKPVTTGDKFSKMSAFQASNWEHVPIQ